MNKEIKLVCIVNIGKPFLHGIIPAPVKDKIYTFDGIDSISPNFIFLKEYHQINPESNPMRRIAFLKICFRELDYNLAEEIEEAINKEILEPVLIKT